MPVARYDVGESIQKNLAIKKSSQDQWQRPSDCIEGVKSPKNVAILNCIPKPDGFTLTKLLSQLDRNGISPIHMKEKWMLTASFAEKASYSMARNRVHQEEDGPLQTCYRQTLCASPIGEGLVG